MAKLVHRWLPVLLILAYFALGMAHATHASITFDEGPHLAIGYATLRTGDFRLQPVHIHPPLANVLAAAPLLLQSDLPDPRTVDGWEIASLSAITDAVVWQYPHPARIATAGRVPMLLLSVLLGTLIYRWAKDLGGWRAGLLALTLYVFDPNCIAHGSLITTDMPAVFFIVATLYLTSCALRVANSELRITNHELRIMVRPSVTRLVAIGVLMGLAQLAKVSALMLVPVVGLLLLIRGLANYELRVTNYVLRFAFYVLRAWLIVFGIAALVVWAGYGFEIGIAPGFPFPLPAATHIRIFQSLREHYELGHPTFLMGQVGDHGWWWYFPVAFALKTPLPVLMMVAGCAFGVGTLKRWDVPAFKRQIGRFLSLFLFPMLYAASSLFSSVNIGYRHLLPLLPFLYVGIGNRGWVIGKSLSRIANHESRITNYILRFTFYVLIIWLIVGTVALAPHFLTFFNEIAGGARGGYRYLVDSNLDWGQSLWDLRRWMVENSEDHVYYAHYSPARPDVYGINADFLPPDPRTVAFAPWNPAPGLYAIGATVLQGPYAPEINTYAWFRAREPLARLGNALWVYRVPLRETPVWAAICAGVPVAAESVSQRLAVDTLRIIQPDCARASVYPAGQQPGVLLMPPDRVPPDGARLDVALRSPAGKTELEVYRLSGAPPVPENIMTDIEIDGPLVFLGYTLDANVMASGKDIVLQTYWRVREAPARPLSLMAHLIGPDGSAVAVGDGLGFPIEQWQPGDVIVQQHVLAVPAEAQPGAYTVITGAYWLDTLERWTVDPGQTQIVLATLVRGDQR